MLIFQRDLGSSLLFFGVFVILLYVATERASWLVYGFVLFFGGVYFTYTQFGHVQNRVDLWLNPFPADPEQISESLYGLAAGGLIGTGLTEGYPERVPFAKTDFIIATLGEELGLAGLMAVLVIYLIIVERGLRTALIVRDGFGKLLAAGLSVEPRAAGVRGRRRRDRADPADRPHHAVPVVRWIVADRELDLGRPAPAGEPCRAPPGPAGRAGQPRGDDPGGETRMNKPLRRVALACLLLFGMLLVNANMQQFVLADERRSDPKNRRVLLAEYSRQRGPILVASNRSPLSSRPRTS